MKLRSDILRRAFYVLTNSQSAFERASEHSAKAKIMFPDGASHHPNVIEVPPAITDLAWILFDALEVFPATCTSRAASAIHLNELGEKAYLFRPLRYDYMNTHIFYHQSNVNGFSGKCMDHTLKACPSCWHF